MSAVCGVDVNDEEHENRHGSLEFVNGFQDVTATGDEHHSMLSTRAKISSLCQRGVGKDQNIVEKVAQETAKTATEEFTVSVSEVVLRSQSEYGQTKSVKTRRSQRGRHVIR